MPAGGFNVLKGASRQLDSQLAGLSARTGSLSGVFAAVGPAGVAAGAAVGAAVLGIGAAMDRARTAIDKLDKLDDTAIKLGVTAEGLQALRFAFQNNGVAAQVTDAAIEKLNDSIGQMAALGEKAPQTIRRAFAQLGIEVRDTTGRVKGAEEVMAEMADGIAGLGSQAERVQIARALMGRGGAALLPLLQQGTDSLRAMTIQARELGVVIDEHLVKSASATADKLDAMAQITEAQLNEAFLDLAPLILDVAVAFATAAGWIARLTDGFREVERMSTAGLKERFLELRAEMAALDRPQGLIGEIVPRRGRAEIEAEIALVEAQIRLRADEREARRAQPASVGTETGNTAATLDKAAARAIETNARVLADLRRQLETFGDERQQSIDRALARLADGARYRMAAEQGNLHAVQWLWM